MIRSLAPWIILALTAILAVGDEPAQPTNGEVVAPDGPVAPDPSTHRIERTNTDSARAREADTECQTLSWLAEQEWFDRSAYARFGIQVGPHRVLGLWPPPSENREPGQVTLTLHRIADDEFYIYITLQEEATYQQVERVLLQLANGESPEIDFTIDDRDSVIYAAGTAPESAAVGTSGEVYTFDELATGQIIGKLGLPLGTFCTIRGVWIEDPARFKTTEWWFRVTHIDGDEPPELLEYPIFRVDFANGNGEDEPLANPVAGEVWELRVFEEISYEGTPRGYWEEARMLPGAGAPPFSLKSRLNYVHGTSLGVQ